MHLKDLFERCRGDEFRVGKVNSPDQHPSFSDQKYLLRHVEPGQAVGLYGLEFAVEAEIWGRNDGKEIHQQVLRYCSSDT